MEQKCLNFCQILELTSYDKKADISNQYCDAPIAKTIGFI